MRISDWSSDVCSSDLVQLAAVDHLAQRAGDGGALADRHVHRVVVAGEGATAGGLGLVHRGVGLLEQFGRHLAVVGVDADADRGRDRDFLALVDRSEEHTSELQSLMCISYAVFCLNNKKRK